MIFLQNKGIKLIASSAVFLSLVGLSGCHRGPVMQSQGQATNNFDSGYSLFGGPNKKTPDPVNVKSST